MRDDIVLLPRFTQDKKGHSDRVPSLKKQAIE